LKKSNHLKRPGSPNLSASETSGNESSRKKHKKKHQVSSSQPTGTSTPVPSRPMSPAPSSSAPGPTTSPRKSSIIKLNLNPSKLSEIQSAEPKPSHMSDGEGTAGEMSDGAGGRKKKSIKLRLGGAGSQCVSRAGSPAIHSRAGSPAVAAGAQSMQIIHFSPPTLHLNLQIIFIRLLHASMLGNDAQLAGICKYSTQESSWKMY
jgi:transcription initiation factor TFIIF subunit alpha